MKVPKRRIQAHCCVFDKLVVNKGFFNTLYIFFSRGGTDSSCSIDPNAAPTAASLGACGAVAGPS